LIYLFSIFWLYLITLIFYGAYAYEMVENFDVPYKETELERKTASVKERYTLWYLGY